MPRMITLGDPKRLITQLLMTSAVVRGARFLTGNTPPTLVVLGTGGLARGLCYALATTTRLPLDLVVVGRRQGRSDEVCYVGAARAALADTPVVFHSLTVNTASEQALIDLIGSVAPDGVFLAASSQSPWERTTAPSAWTELVARAGFGLTLPFQAELALRTASALAQARPDAWFVNACFPDAVNPVLAARSLPVLCGVGNVALLAASIQAALGLPDQRKLSVLAHHAHLHAPHDEADEAMAWLGGKPLAGVGALLAAQRAADRPELNHVTGMAAATLVRALLSGDELATSLPGPLGLPGGYPVRVAGARVELRLPDGMDRDDAVAANQRAAVHDGVVVDGGRVRFTSPAVAALDQDLAHDFSVTEIERVTDRLDRLRTRLRDRPPSSRS